MQRDVCHRVRTYCETQGLLREGTTVLTGVSGGADSVCLFLLLHDLAAQLHFSLEVMHVHHGLRPEAEDEAAYVRELCADYDVPFHLARVDVTQAARQPHRSIEEAARKLRYDALLGCADRIGADDIAVAHTVDDQAETVLYRLFRGTGLSGLGGMRPRNGRIVRPLLILRRTEVLSELDRRGVAYRTDSSNDSDAYARNYIRHHILTHAARVNAQAAAHIADAATQLSSAEDYLAQQAALAYEQCVVPSRQGQMVAGLQSHRPDIAAPGTAPGEPSAGGASMGGRTAAPGTADTGDHACLRIDRAAFLALHPYLQERLLLRALSHVAGQARDISAVHIRDLQGLFLLPTGKRLDLPYRMSAVRERGAVVLYPAGAGFPKKETTPVAPQQLA